MTDANENASKKEELELSVAAGAAKTMLATGAAYLASVYVSRGFDAFMELRRSKKTVQTEQ